MVFILQLVIMVYHIDWFIYTEKSLNPWDKFHLIMIYMILLMEFWILFASILLRIFASMFTSDTGLWFWRKTESISFKTISKRRMSTLPTTIQRTFGSPCHDNLRRKATKRNPNWKRSEAITVCRWCDTTQPSLSADDMILCNHHCLQMMWYYATITVCRWCDTLYRKS